MILTHRLMVYCEGVHGVLASTSFASTSFASFFEIDRKARTSLGILKIYLISIRLILISMIFVKNCILIYTFLISNKRYLFSIYLY